MWCTIYRGLNDAPVVIWTGIFKIDVQICRDTKLQSFQYRIIHRIITCNKWLKDKKIKDISVCHFVTYVMLYNIVSIVSKDTSILQLFEREFDVSKNKLIFFNCI